jgi:hypothetical protein
VTRLAATDRLGTNLQRRPLAGVVPTFKSQLSAACTTLRFVEVDKAMRPIKGNVHQKNIGQVATNQMLAQH